MLIISAIISFADISPPQRACVSCRDKVLSLITYCNLCRIAKKQ